MKKYIVLSLAVLLIVPQITFAVWWNPMTWNVFKFLKRAEVKIEQVASTTDTQANAEPGNKSQAEIEQLKKEIEDLKKSQTSKTSTTQTGLKGLLQTATPKTNETTQTASKLNLELCATIYDEEKVLNENLSQSFRYFQQDLIPIFDSQVKTTDYSMRYDNLNKVRTSFFKALSEFKSKDITRINSEYLDESYTQDIKDHFTKLSDGYKEIWETFTLDSLKLKNINFYDSYDKNIGYGLIEKDYKLMEDTYKNLTDILDLWKVMPEKYKAARISLGCPQ